MSSSAWEVEGWRLLNAATHYFEVSIASSRPALSFCSDDTTNDKSPSTSFVSLRPVNIHHDRYPNIVKLSIWLACIQLLTPMLVKSICWGHRSCLTTHCVRAPPDLNAGLRHPSNTDECE